MHTHHDGAHDDRKGEHRHRTIDENKLEQLMHQMVGYMTGGTSASPSGSETSSASTGCWREEDDRPAGGDSHGLQQNGSSASGSTARQRDT